MICFLTRSEGRLARHKLTHEAGKKLKKSSGQSSKSMKKKKDCSVDIGTSPTPVGKYHD